ncbi:MAG: hypothetical protein V7604_2889 [Hyphomicrobiales bacterium]|jgi:hypothetical protein
MQAKARSVLPPAIAALAVSLSILTVPELSSTANAVETCLAAPKGAAPQGSHWYYRVEQSSQRKCWRLVQKDQKGRSAAAPTDPQGDVDEETEAVAAPPAAKSPGAKKPAIRVTEPAAKAAPDLVTKYASDTEAAPPPVPWSDPPTEMVQRLDTPSAPAPVAQTQNDAPAPAPTAEPPVQQPVAAADNAAPVPAAGDASTLQFAFAALAFLVILTCAIFCIASARRRRTDVLRKAQHLNALPTEVAVAPDAPTFAPLPPMSLMPQHDDVEEAMQRFAERWKRRAA